MSSDDALVDTVTTGKDGRAYLPLEAGDYYAVETELPQLVPAGRRPHLFHGGGWAGHP